MEKLIRFGIWGTGAIAQQVAVDFPLAEGAVLHAVASRTLERAQAFASVYGAVNAYEGLDALLADQAVDVVYIASPNQMHVAECLQVIEAGKGVLCEKPFTLNEAEAQQVADAAGRRGVFCMEAMWTRFIPAIIEVRRMIAAGEIGTVSLLEGNFADASAEESGSRFIAAALGGGALLDRGVYLVSLAQHLLGEPDRIHSVALLNESGADVTSSIQLSWKSGAMANFFSSLRLNGSNDAMIFGDRGSVLLAEPFYRPHRLEIKRTPAPAPPTGEASARPFARSKFPAAAWLLRRRMSPAFAYLRRGSVRNLLFAGNGYQFQLMEVVKCVRQGQTQSAVMPLADSITVMRMMDAIRAQWTA